MKYIFFSKMSKSPTEQIQHKACWDPFYVSDKVLRQFPFLGCCVLFGAHLANITHYEMRCNCASSFTFFTSQVAVTTIMIVVK